MTAVSSSFTTIQRLFVPFLFCLSKDEGKTTAAAVYWVQDYFCTWCEHQLSVQEHSSYRATVLVRYTRLLF